MTEREARKLAKEVVSDEYAVIDEIWNRRRVNYHSVAVFNVSAFFFSSSFVRTSTASCRTCW